MRSDTDLRLARAMAGAARGDANAFEPVVYEFERPVYAFLQRMCGEPEVAAELCQETMLRAFRAAARFRCDSELRPWLFRIARNLAIDHLRRAERRFGRAEVDVDAVVPETSGGGASNPEQLFEQRAAVRTVEKALRELRPAYREVLLLGLVEELNYEEMAQVTGQSSAAVKARFLRARLALREVLDHRQGEDASS